MFRRGAARSRYRIAITSEFTTGAEHAVRALVRSRRGLLTGKVEVSGRTRKISRR